MNPATKSVVRFLIGALAAMPHCAVADETELETESRNTDPIAPAEIHWHLGVALNLVTSQKISFTAEPLNSGYQVPGDLDRIYYGPSNGPVVIEAGYVLANRLVLGAMLDFGSARDSGRAKDPEIDFKLDQALGSFVIGPHVAYHFAPELRLRPFCSLALGYTSVPSEQLDQALRISMIQGFMGLGVSYFFTPSFSIDTTLRAAYGKGSGYIDSGVAKNASISGSVITLMWLVGTSGWLG